MNPEQLWETTMNPETRSLIRLNYSEPVQDASPEQIILSPAQRDEEVFELLMGPEVPPRRGFIEAGAGYARLDI